MRNQNPVGKLSLKKELTKNELKQITGGVSLLQQTYCSGPDAQYPYATAFPTGQQPIGCAPAYCLAAGHGSFLYCA